MEEHLKFLGHKCRDAATGFMGVVTSISFDLAGCVQALITPAVDQDGKFSDSRWFDTKRLQQLSDVPLIPQPTFIVVPGGQELPGYELKPSL